MEPPSLENPIRQKTEQPLPTLPPDLVVEILTWLPVVSLLRFRSVSKWFKTLISSPDFVQAHLKNMKALSNVKPNRVDRLFRRSLNFVHRLTKPKQGRFRLSPPVIDWGSYSWSVESLYNEPRLEAAQLGNIFEGVDDGGDWIFGSCDGLLCSVLMSYLGVVVWNPSTRVMRELPAFHCDITEEQMHGCHEIFGFGYDCQLDDYKVVVVISYPAENSNGIDDFVTQVQVFALKANSWRRIEDFKYGVPLDEGVKFAAGCLHYKVQSLEGEGNIEWKDTLVSLDLTTEKYHKVKLPDSAKLACHWGLGSLDDRRLCVACFDDGDSCDVWVVEEPGVTEAWTKLFRVSQLGIEVGLCAPLYISDNGEALWDNDEDLFIHSSKDNTIRFPASRGLTGRDGPAVIYMETLVSP